MWNQDAHGEPKHLHITSSYELLTNVVRIKKGSFFLWEGVNDRARILFYAED
jgi:hypothetical protein